MDSFGEALAFLAGRSNGSCDLMSDPDRLARILHDQLLALQRAHRPSGLALLRGYKALWVLLSQIFLLGHGT
jgi:hypothetical protein